MLQDQPDHGYDVRRESSLHRSSEHALSWSCWSSSAQVGRANAPRERIHARLLFGHTEANSPHLILASTKSASRSVISGRTTSFMVAANTTYSSSTLSSPTLHSKLVATKTLPRNLLLRSSHCNPIMACTSWQVVHLPYRATELGSELRYAKNLVLIATAVL